MSSRNCGQINDVLVNNANNANNNNKARLIDNSDTIDRIARLTTPQITENSLENDLLNGTRFNDNDSFVSLILPSGFS